MELIIALVLFFIIVFCWGRCVRFTLRIKIGKNLSVELVRFGYPHIFACVAVWLIWSVLIVRRLQNAFVAMATNLDYLLGQVLWIPKTQSGLIRVCAWIGGLALSAAVVAIACVLYRQGIFTAPMRQTYVIGVSNIREEEDIPEDKTKFYFMTLGDLRRVVISVSEMKNNK